MVNWQKNFITSTVNPEGMLKLPSQRRKKTGSSQGYLNPSYLTSLVQGARRWSLLIIKALGEASRRLPVLVKSVVQQWGSKQGKATSACHPSKKLVGRESLFAVVVFACNKKKHSQLSERELSAQAVEQRPKKALVFWISTNSWKYLALLHDFYPCPHPVTTLPPKRGDKTSEEKKCPCQITKETLPGTE